jgi:hypothetical protein
MCSYLGGNNCLVEGYNIMTDTYADANKNTATIKTNVNSSNTITVTKLDGTINEYTTSVGDTSGIFYNPSGSTAKVSSDLKKITITNADKTVTIFNSTKRDTSSGSGTGSGSGSRSGSGSGSRSGSGTGSGSGSYDNYNHYSGSSYASIYYGPNGATARLVDTGNNSTMVITHQNGSTDIYYIDNNTNKKAYYGPNNSFAKLTGDTNGKTAIEVTSAYGNKSLYTEKNMNTFSNMTMVTEGFDTNKNMDSNTNKDKVNNNKSVTNYDPNTFLKSLPTGVPKSDIPSGHEDLYILKSQVVPPVCPACPPPIVNGSNVDSTNKNSSMSGSFDVSKCPPCPPCARCPEPSFECKKVANYSAFNPNTMPVPALNSFSTFGM